MMWHCRCWFNSILDLMSYSATHLLWTWSLDPHKPLSRLVEIVIRPVFTVGMLQGGAPEITMQPDSIVESLCRRPYAFWTLNIEGFIAVFSMSEHNIGGTGTLRWSFLWHRHERILNTTSTSHFYFDNRHCNLTLSLVSSLRRHIYIYIYNDVCVCVSWSHGSGRPTPKKSSLSMHLKAKSMTRNDPNALMGPNDLMPSERVWHLRLTISQLSWLPPGLSNATCLPSWAKRSAASSGSQPQRFAETGLEKIVVICRDLNRASDRFDTIFAASHLQPVHQVHQVHLQDLQALSTGQLSQEKNGPSKSSAKAFLIGGASMRWVSQGGSNSPCGDGIALDGNHAITLQSQPGSEMSRRCSFPSSRPVGTLQFSQPLRRRLQSLSPLTSRRI